jgi:hypothetical protein
MHILLDTTITSTFYIISRKKKNRETTVKNQITTKKTCGL